MSRITHLLRRHLKVLAVATVAVFALAGGAYGYFTATGTGTGSDAVGTSSSLSVSGTATTTLYPGTSSTVSFTVNNPSSGHQQLGTISLSGVHACTGSGSSWNGTACSNGGTEQTGCESYDTSTTSTVDDFSMQNVVANQDIASGSGQPVTATGTLTMNNLNSNQNACQSANVTLSFTAS